MKLTEGLGSASARLAVSVPVYLISGDRRFQRNLDQGHGSVTHSDQSEVFMEATFTGARKREQQQGTAWWVAAAEEDVLRVESGKNKRLQQRRLGCH